MNLLAFDTSTETLSIAVQRGDETLTHEGAGGAQASAQLIGQALRLLQEAGLRMQQLDAIVFGRGPGAFTGLRTACAVAQGLAWGAGVPVLPLDTLHAVAENARQQHGCTRVLACLDARMGELYAAPWQWQPGACAAGGLWHSLAPARVCAPADLALPAGADAPQGWALVGQAGVYADQLPAPLAALPRYSARPAASALLVLAAPLLAAGQALPADQALPLYVRDKVAQTTAERLAARAQAAAHTPPQT